MKEKAINLYENTDYALVGGDGLTVYYMAWVLRGMQQFTEDTIVNTDFANYLMDAIVDWNIAFLDESLAQIGDFIEIQWLADDWGVQAGPFISPKMFRETVVPRIEKLINIINRKTQAKICYHTCGSTYWLLDDLIKMGVDIVHPLQANAEGNEDAERLKREYSNRIVFHGNTNNQGVFHKSRNEVIADALYRIKHLTPGGGYIFSSGHNIQANMPPENIMALFETALEYGKYPIDVKNINKELQRLTEENPEI